MGSISAISELKRIIRMPIGITPKMMTARVAAYRDAIDSARADGLTWNEIALLIGVENGIKLRQAVVRAKAGIESGRLAPQQRPLPIPSPPDMSRTFSETGLEEKSGFEKKREPIKFDDD